MAVAFRTSVEVPITTITLQEVVTLTLSIEEALCLRAICAHVGGDPKTTRRGLTDSIKDALSDAGLSHYDDDDMETHTLCFGRRK